MNKIEQINEKIEYIQNENLHLNIKYSNINKAVGLLKSAKLYKINTRSQMLIDLINLALKDIFFDKDVKIDIKSNETNSGITGYNVTYDIVFYSNGNELGKNQDVYDSTGGGLITIISFILKILMGYINDTGKFFIFDEAFSQLSSKYLDNLSYFIRELCEKYNFTILFIAHEDISKHAHISYRLKGSVKDGIDTLLLDSYDLNICIEDKVITTPSELVDYYLLKAEKFQSISKIELPIKGFTCIRGDSGIGKTSVARAINSIINNDFKDKYKRINTRGSTIIQFGFVNSEKEYNKITLEYKGSTVHYILNSGEELKGKALAKDRISEALEEMGFKRIDLSVYKSWNSELANQTARVNVTTQHDKLYFSNERNSTEKLLTLLFNSENFNEGIREGSEYSQNVRQAIVKNEELIVELYYQKLLETRNRFLDIIERIQIVNRRKVELEKSIASEIEIRNKKLRVDKGFEAIRKLSAIINKSNTNMKAYKDLKLISSSFESINNKLYLINNIKNKLVESNKKYEYSNILIETFRIQSELSQKSKIIQNKIIVYSEVEKLSTLSRVFNFIQICNTNSNILISERSRIKIIDERMKYIVEGLNSIKDLAMKINTLKKIKEVQANSQNVINSHNSVIAKLEKNMKIINNLDNLTKFNNLKFKIDSILNMANSISSLNNRLVEIQSEIASLNASHNEYMCMVEDCPHCSGLGYIIKG